MEGSGVRRATAYGYYTLGRAPFEGLFEPLGPGMAFIQQGTFLGRVGTSRGGQLTVHRSLGRVGGAGTWRRRREKNFWAIICSVKLGRVGGELGRVGSKYLSRVGIFPQQGSGYSLRQGSQIQLGRVVYSVGQGSGFVARQGRRILTCKNLVRSAG